MIDNEESNLINQNSMERQCQFISKAWKSVMDVVAIHYFPRLKHAMQIKAMKIVLQQSPLHYSHRDQE